MSGRTVVVRLDSLGDLLVCGPAIRAVAADSRVTLLCGPAGAAAARLLPGVADVLVWACPWIDAHPPLVSADAIAELVTRLRAISADDAVILTSFHQSALPTALVLRMSGIGRITAISEDYPGTLLDRRLPSPADAPEPERMLAVARAAGYDLPAGDRGGLAVRTDLLDAVDARVGVPEGEYLVVHPGATAPARRYPAESWAECVRVLTRRGRHILVTGSAAEAGLTAEVAAAAVGPGTARDCGGRLSLVELAAALRCAVAVAVANTGPAHLAAAVGTPVISLFAPVVPAARWAPYGEHVLLGDQSARCSGSRARECPVPGHPCLASVPPSRVVDALEFYLARAGSPVEQAAVSV
jgi:ADP-heptose:LPS heptosyltransferase